MNIKSILLFIGGLTVGCVSGVISTKKYFQYKYQKQYENDLVALQEYFGHIDEYSRKRHDDEELEDDQNKDSEVDSRPGGRMTDEERAEVKEKLNRNWEGTTNYAGMYKNVEHEDTLIHDQMIEPAVDIPITDTVCKNCSSYDSEQCICQITDEKVMETDCCSDFESIYESPEEQAHNEHQKNKNRSPKIISEETYSNLPAYIDKDVLYFYTYDEVLVSDENEIIEEPNYLIGDVLTKYNFIENDERIIFVMNYALDTCYEIQKIYGCWVN